MTTDTASVYAWMVYEAERDRWEMIAAVIPFMAARGMTSPIPLIHSSREMVEHALGPIAAQHRQTTGKPVALFHLTGTTLTPARGHHDA